LCLAPKTLNLAAHLLVNAGDPVWMEDPGYIGARGALLGAGAQIVPVPIDDEGLIVDAGITRAPKARLVYLTPSHQFPLGVTMSLARRLALLGGPNVLVCTFSKMIMTKYRLQTSPAALQGWLIGTGDLYGHV
jgi:histidinol-phosphate/aromatic aminotransferase/cobyric acid decarboxylase-like protein